ncbi:hypothetical protein V6N13_053487 [Hibiscus sabdariffa]
MPRKTEAWSINKWQITRPGRGAKEATEATKANNDRRNIKNRPTMRPGRDNSATPKVDEQPCRGARASKPRHKRKACTPRKMNT